MAIFNSFLYVYQRVTRRKTDTSKASIFVLSVGRLGLRSHRLLSRPLVGLVELTKMMVGHVGYTKFNIVTLWLFNIAMENGPFIDGLPIINGDFPWLC